MDDQYKKTVKAIARGLKAQSRDPRVKVFLSYLYTSDIFNKYLDTVLTYKNVSRAGFSVLHYLVLNGGSMIPTVISKKTARSKYSVTRVIDTLEKMGLVERLPAGKDRRTRRVRITEKGREKLLECFVDISARVQAEAALRESEARIRAVTDSAQDAILMMGPDGRISYWNPMAESAQILEEGFVETFSPRRAALGEMEQQHPRCGDVAFAEKLFMSGHFV